MKLELIEKLDSIFSLYKCNCGNIKRIRAKDVKDCKTKSCGCLKQSMKGQLHPSYKHGLTAKIPEYGIWQSMIRRCHNKTDKTYQFYGARGIYVCDRWINSFTNFYQDMGQRPSEKYSIDRIDNNKGYYKENCKWSTSKEQSNNRRKCKYINYNNKTQTIKQWSEELGIPEETIHSRIKKNVDIDTALGKKNLVKKMITFNGETKSIKEWSDIVGIKYSTLVARLKKNSSIEQCLTCKTGKKYYRI